MTAGTNPAARFDLVKKAMIPTQSFVSEWITNETQTYVPQSVNLTIFDKGGNHTLRGCHTKGMTTVSSFLN